MKRTLVMLIALLTLVFAHAAFALPNQGTPYDAPKINVCDFVDLGDCD
jgi:hypothetical protein